MSVSSSRKKWFFAIVAAVVAIGPALNATPIEPAAKQPLNEVQRAKPMFVPVRVGWDSTPASNFNLTFERYGPQATARAVRASLWVALTPDPIAIGALLFCAFALRWMRMSKKERAGQPSSELSSAEVVMPKAA
jgi:hypothetical protein